MNIVRKIALSVLGALFVFILFNLVFVFSIINVAGDSSKIKHILAHTHIYSTIIPDLLNQAKVASGDQAQIPLNQKVVLDSAAKAFTPQIVQSNAETAIDGTYAWLDGKYAAPQFQLNLTQAKANFASAIAQAAVTQVAALPVCPAGTPIQDKFDPFSATCLPAGITPAQAGVLAQQAVNGNQGFLNDPVINAGELKNNQGKLLFTEQFKDVPRYYRDVKKAPLILIILSISLAVVIVLLSQSHLRGLRHVGIVLVISGMIILIYAWGLNYGINQKALPKLSVKDNAVITRDAKALITEVTQSIDKYYWWFGGIYITLGVGSIIGSQILIRRQQPRPDQEAAETGTNPKPQQTKAEAKPYEVTSKPKSTPKKVKIQ